MKKLFESVFRLSLAGLLLSPPPAAWHGAGAGLALLLAASPSEAVPQRINFQGRLTDTSGGPVSTPQTITFKLFDPDSGALLWEETHTDVAVQNGVFSVQLGTKNLVSPILNVFANPDAELEIWVGPGTSAQKLEPRERLAASPWAGNSLRLDGQPLSSFVLQSGSLNLAGPGPHTILNGNVGVGTTQPGHKLDVSGGDANVSGVYRKGGTAGASTACAAGQVLKGAVVSGGIVTGGTCAADDSGSGTVTAVTASAPLASSGGATPNISLGTVGIADGGTGATTAPAALAALGAVAKSGDTMTGPLGLPANGLSVGTSQLVASGGKVGVGTTAPAEALDVAGSIKAGANVIVGGQVLASAGANPGFSFSGDTNTGIKKDGTQNMLFLAGNSGGLRITNMVTSIPSDRPFQTQFNGGASVAAIGWTTDVDSGLSRLAADNIALQAGGVMTFQVKPSAAIVTGSLATTGNVGVGTTNPPNRLTLSGNTQAAASIGFDPTAPGLSFGLLFRDASGTLRQFVGHDAAGAGPDALAINSDKVQIKSVSGAAKVAFDNVSGNVGIGTTQPGARLEVAGSLRLSNGVQYGELSHDNGNTTILSDNLRVGGTLATSNIGANGVGNSVTVGWGVGSLPALIAKIQGSASATGAIQEWRAYDNSVKARLNADGTLEAARFLGDGSDLENLPSPDLAPLTLDPTNQRVGIGTTGPSEKLTVAGNILAAGDLIGDLVIARRGSNRMIANGDYGNAGTHAQLGSTLAMRLAPGFADAMTLTTAGNVGIGTTGPEAKLDVRADDADKAIIGRTYGTTGTNQDSPKLCLFGGGTGSGPCIQKINTGSYGHGRLAFWQRNASDYSTLFEAMVLDRDGNLGVGTTGPQQKVHVYESDASATILAETGEPGGSAQFAASIPSDGASAFYTAFQGNTIANLRGSVDGTVGGRLDLQTQQDGGAFATRLSVRHDGRVGIGTTSPGYILDAQGGQINASGGLCMAGLCKASWSEVVGASQWSNGASLIYYNGGNVGIGTAGPSRPLHVEANNSIITRLVRPDGANTQLNIESGSGAALKEVQLGAYDIGGGSYRGWVGTGSNHPFELRTNSVTRLFLDTAGNVGIGTTSPSTRLQVVHGGQGAAEIYRSDAGTDGYALRVRSEQKGGDLFVVYQGDHRTSPGRLAYFYDSGSQTTADDVVIQSYGLGDHFKVIDGASAASLVVKDGGNVGVGTASPAAPLHLHKAGVSTLLSITNTADGADFGVDHGELRIRTLNAEPIVFHPGDAGEKLRVVENGNVGLGTASPSERLDVGGGNVKMGYEVVTLAVSIGSPVGWYYASCPSGKFVLGGACATGNGTYGHSTDVTGTSYGCYKWSTDSNWQIKAICANIR